MIEPLVVVIIVSGHRILALDEIMDEFVEEAIASNDMKMLYSSSYKAIKEKRETLSVVFFGSIVLLVLVSASI